MGIPNTIGKAIQFARPLSTESPEGMTLYSHMTSMRYSKQCAHTAFTVYVCASSRIRLSRFNRL